MKGHVSIVFSQLTAELLFHVLTGLLDYRLLENIAMLMMRSVFLRSI